MPAGRTSERVPSASARSALPSSANDTVSAPADPLGSANHLAGDSARDDERAADRGRDDLGVPRGRTQRGRTELHDTTDARSSQCVSERLLRGRRAGQERSFAGEQEPELRVGVELPARDRLELERLRLARLLAGFAALRERERGRRRHEAERDERDREQELKPAPPAMGVGELLLDRPLRPVPRAPREHRLREDVVEDLVAHGAALVERAQDAPVGEHREHRREHVLRHLAEVREVGRLVRDLRPGRRDEVVEEPRRDVLLLRRELRERTLEVLLDDVARASQPGERRGAERVRSRRALLVPEPLHHELEVRRLDPFAGLVPSTAPRPPRAARSARTDLVQHALDELRLDRDRLAGELAEALDRPHDGRARRLAIEAVEPQRVREDTGDRGPRSGRASRASPRAARRAR